MGGICQVEVSGTGVSRLMMTSKTVAMLDFKASS